jgi:hypothetical protein
LTGGGDVGRLSTAECGVRTAEWRAEDAFVLVLSAAVLVIVIDGDSSTRFDYEHDYEHEHEHECDGEMQGR